MPGHPARPLYLVVVWDPWNWAAMAVSRELLPEAERDGRLKLSSCSWTWWVEGGAPACPIQCPSGCQGLFQGLPKTTAAACWLEMSTPSPRTPA
jgi:hypothetical protein